MAEGLLNNSSAAFNMSAEVADGDAELSIQALRMTTGPTGGREVSGQIYVVVPEPETGTTVYNTTHIGLFTDGTAVVQILYSDGATPAPYYTRTEAGKLAEEQTIRVDFKATLHDQAFEEYDSYGGTRKRDEPQRF